MHLVVAVNLDVDHLDLSPVLDLLVQFPGAADKNVGLAVCFCAQEQHQFHSFSNSAHRGYGRRGGGDWARGNTAAKNIILGQRCAYKQMKERASERA